MFILLAATFILLCLYYCYVYITGCFILIANWDIKHTSRSSHRVVFSENLSNSAGIYLLKVNRRNTRTRCEICSKLTIKIPERHFIVILYCIFIVNFEHISDLVLVLLFFFIKFEQVNADWETSFINSFRIVKVDLKFRQKV